MNFLQEIKIMIEQVLIIFLINRLIIKQINKYIIDIEENIILFNVSMIYTTLIFFDDYIEIFLILIAINYIYIASEFIF